MSLYLLALLIGIIAGLRAMAAPAAVSWGAYLGWVPVGGTWAAFMGHWIAVAIFSIAAIAELIADQLPSTPSRKVPQQFGARIVTGALSGAVIGAAAGLTVGGVVAGAIGAVLGTYGGAEARTRMAAALGGDRPAALIEDAVAIFGAILIIGAVT